MERSKSSYKYEMMAGLVIMGLSTAIASYEPSLGLPAGFALGFGLKTSADAFNGLYEKSR